MILEGNFFELTDEQLVSAAATDIAREEAQLKKNGWDIEKDPAAKMIFDITYNGDIRTVAWVRYFRDRVHPRVGNWLDAHKMIPQLASKGTNIVGETLDALITHPIMHVPVILAEHQKLSDVELAKMLIRFEDHSSIWEMLFERQRKLHLEWSEGLPTYNYSPSNAVALMRSGAVKLDFMEQSNIPILACPWPKEGNTNKGV